MSLTVTGIGMISAVGHDVITACASIRAGIIRPSEILHCPVLDEDSHKTEPLSGYPICNYTDGFGSVGRWLIMGVYAIKNLINYSSLPDKGEVDFWQRTAFVFVTPTLDAARFEFEGVIDPQNIQNVLINPIISRLGLPVQISQCISVSEDNTGFISSCFEVTELLNQDNIERVIVVCVDSNIDAYALSWLNGTLQLKTSARPNGLIPGEGSVAILIEKEKSMNRRGVKSLLTIDSASTKKEDNDIFSDVPNTGDGLRKAIEEVLSSQYQDTLFSGSIYSDLNGEQWRAREYAGARVNLLNKVLAPNVIEIIPATSLGDVGVVHVALSICMMIESKRRGYSHSDNALIVASSASGSTGALSVSVL